MKDVAKLAASECRVGRRVHVAGHPLALTHGEGAQVIDAVGLVGMVVGEQHAIDPLRPRVDHLRAEIRRSYR